MRNFCLYSLAIAMVMIMASFSPVWGGDKVMLSSFGSVTNSCGGDGANGSDILWRYDVTPTGVTEELKYTSPNFNLILGLVFHPHSRQLFIGNRSPESYFGGGLLRYDNVLATPTGGIAPLVLPPGRTGFFLPHYMSFRNPGELLLAELAAPYVSRWLVNEEGALTGIPSTIYQGKRNDGSILNFHPNYFVFSVKMSPWGEAFVSVHSPTEGNVCCGSPGYIFRYTFSENGEPVFNGELDQTLLQPNPMIGTLNMTFSPWGELFVISSSQYAGTMQHSRIYRFRFDEFEGSRKVVAASLMADHLGPNGMNTAVAGAFSSWGELFVVNYFANRLSRFKFNSDENHTLASQGYNNITCPAHDIAFVPGSADTTAPTVTSLTVIPSPVAINMPMTLTASLSDEGGSGLALSEYRIDGGPYSAFGTPGGNVATVSTALPAFTTTGVREVCVRVRDAAGNQSLDECTVVPVYDPKGGYVMGAGTFISPPGAYVPNPLATGRVQFTFSSRYQVGANVPTGDTQFRFQVGNFVFRSVAYEWLVVSGARAQFKGTGTDGARSLDFLLTAVDGSLPGHGGTDRFRLKVWGPSGIVYDNQLGAGDQMAPSTVITGTIRIPN